MDAAAPPLSLADQAPTWASASNLARNWGLDQSADRLAEKVMTLAVGNVAKGRILVPTMARQWQECANTGHSPRTC
jgi:hypothetical protein